jgi:hypothetical protein
MSTPSEPIIYRRPLTLSNAVELYWQPPVSSGTGLIGNYIIECSNIAYINVVSAADRKCIVGNLTTGTNYTFTIKATNINGNGLISSFNFVIPGFKPDFPTNQDFTTNITDYSKINFTFNNPNYIGDSALTYNTITMLPIDISGNLTRPSLIYNQSSKGSNIINPVVIERMNTNFNYRAYIQSVNTVNDSDKNYFSHIINPNLPTDGLKLWLDPYDLSSITISNNKVVKWNDKSKNRSNAIIQEQFAPTYDYANNLINFNGSQHLMIPNDTIPSGNSSYSIFTYVSTRDITRNGQWFLHSGTPNSNLTLGGLINSNLLVQSWFNNNQTTNFNLTADISYLVEMTYDSGIRRTFINGSLVGQDNVSSRNSSTSNNIIGSNSNLTANLNGSVGDIIIYNRVLNNFERNSVINFLEKRKNDISMVNIGNLVAWLDATDSNSLYDQRIERKASNHNYVYNWLDRSPANNSASQSNVSIIPTRRPVVQNNLGAVEFNQSSMTIPNATYPLNAFIVLRLSNLNDRDGIISVSPNSNNFSSLAYNINGSNTWSITNTANSVLSPFIETSNNMLIMEWNIGNNLNYIRRNGLNLNYSTNGTWSLPNNANIIIGNTNSFDNNRFNGNIGEIIIFNRNIGDDYRYNIEGYLAWKWGLQSQLINSHPFKLSPPYLFYKYNQTIVTESLLINYLAANYTSNVWTNAGYLGVPFNAIAESGTSPATMNVLGNGVSFRGSSALSFPNLGLGNLWSVFVWARRTSSQPNGASFVTQLYDGNNVNLAVFSNISGRVTEKQGTGGYITNNTFFNGSNITMEMNNWYNLSYTWNGTTLTSYINGNLTASVNPGTPSIDNSLPYRIGRKWDPLNTDYIRADIGQILIYNRALSTQEISRNYLITLPNYPQPTVSFFYTGTNQTFTVPTGVTSIYVRLIAAGGKNTTVGGNGIGGKGGLVSGFLPVTPGETLTVLVGGSINISAAPGGTFGGGGGVADINVQGFGGGRTAVMRGSNDVVTAGGGGGGGYYGNGGDGGGLIGGNGTGANSGQGGTQLTGGLAGVGGSNGSIKTGGNGGSQYAGSGGGGYYGGGGGNYSSGQNGGAGGGGSSFVGNLTGVIENIQGGGAANDTAGNVIISW